MADSEASPVPTTGEELNSNRSQTPQDSNQPDPSPTPSSSTPSTSVAINPNPVLPPPPIVAPLQPPSIQTYGVPQVPTMLPGAPSFRPATPPLPVPSAPQFSPLPVLNMQNPNYPSSGVQNPNYPSSGVQNPTVPPPGVGGVPGSVVPMMQQQYAPPGQYRPYMTMPNGYPAMQMPQGALPPPGLPRYPYAPMVRPAFPQRPPGAVGVMSPMVRAPIPGIRGPMIPPIVRPVSVPSVVPAEKPETTVYVGKMSSTVDNEFMLSLLQLCGPIKSWKRPQDPAHGTLKSFGFCEFESAEGVLRALRLLNKLNLDGQELVINVNQATREYLERYVKKKKENINVPKETGSDGTDKSEENAANADSEPPKSDSEDLKKDEKDSGAEEKNDAASFGIVTDDEREADRLALEKLTDMLEERLKNNPLPPPPPPPLPKPADGFGNSNSEHPASSRDGEADVDIMKHDGLEGKNEDEITSDNKPTNEHDRPETSSPDKGARHDRRGRDKDRDQKREKERELERYEREREQERTRREKERENKVKDDERRYKARVKDWEYREREKELLRKQEKEKENNRAIKRKREVLDQEYDDGDGDSKRRKHRSSGTEERRRRLREKEEDMEDQLKEEEEIAEAKRKAEEEMRQKKEREKDVPEISPNNTNHKSVSPHEVKDMVVDETSDGDIGHQNHIGEGMIRNGNGDDSITEQVAASDTRQNNNVHKRLGLGFGLVGSGKRTAVPSVFSEDEDENAQKEKKMRPLVPIDYSTEEVQAVQSTTVSSPPSNLAAAAEFAKRISSGTPKEDRPDVEKERSRRSHDRYNQRDRDRNDDDSSRTRDSSRRTGERDRDRDRDRDMDKVKTPENRKLMDAKQLIDMIPKTKDELFSYEINWAVYDKNELHDRLRPWIAKKITEFLGEEETTLVDYIVSSMREHVKASEMLDRLQSILDDESEMFVLKMWRMLIFEIKKIETGLALRSKS